MFPACQNLLLAARALGYGGVLTGLARPGREGAAAAARDPRRRRAPRLHHARRAGRAPRAAAPQAARHDRPRRGVGPRAPTGSASGVTEDPYAILGVDRGATEEELRAARRRLARQVHPDRAGGTAAATVAMQRLNAGVRRRPRRSWGRRPPPRREPARATRRAHPPPPPPAPVPRPGGRLAHDVASFTIEALPAEAFEALVVVASWIGEVIDDDPPYRLDTWLGEPYELLVPPRPRPRRRRQHRGPDARHDRRPPRPRPRHRPRHLGRRAEQARPRRRRVLTMLRVARATLSIVRTGGRRWPS